jgi:DNA mismatch repair ATPase MutS
MLEYVKVPLLSDVRNYNRAMSLIKKNSGAFLTLYQRIGALDAAAAVLSFRKSLPHWTCPEFLEENGIAAEGLFHPLLDAPVPNDVHIARSSLVSGSNASGKSTFIKALAISGIFAQTIHTCPARVFRTRFALVVTSMAVRDDIIAGESYFITEIKSLRRVLDVAQDTYCTCYIDEILKGTNTVERIAASAAVLRYIGMLDCLCVAATHDIELTRMLAGSWDNYHFSEQITDDGMRFDYTVKPGPSRTRNAIRLLGYMKFDDRIIADAQRMVKHFEQAGSWDEPH